MTLRGLINTNRSIVYLSSAVQQNCKKKTDAVVFFHEVSIHTASTQITDYCGSGSKYKDVLRAQ